MSERRRPRHHRHVLPPRAMDGAGRGVRSGCLALAPSQPVLRSRPCWAGWAIRWSIAWSARFKRNTAVILVFSAMSLLPLVAVVHPGADAGTADRDPGRSLPITATGSSAPRCPGSNNAPVWRSCPGSIRAPVHADPRAPGSALAGSLPRCHYVRGRASPCWACSANIVLLPVLAFFFLRDWDLLVARRFAALPRDHADTVRKLARGIR